MTVTMTVTAYTVTAVHSPGWAGVFDIKVEFAGSPTGGAWAVRWLGRCLDRNGQWEFEPLPSARTDEWLADHRFDRDTALRLAHAAAPQLTVKGTTAQEADLPCPTT